MSDQTAMATKFRWKIDDRVEILASTPEMKNHVVYGTLEVYQDDELLDRDRPNLTSARERTRYVKRLADLGIKLDSALLVEIEDALRGSIMTAEPTSAPDPRSGEVDPDLVTRAEALLDTKDMLRRGVAVMQRRGLVGEEANAKILLLAGVSGVLGEPIHAVLHGDSSGGKNHLVKRATELLPPKFVLATSSLSAHALEYRGGQIEGVLLIDEAEGQGEAEYGLRVAMSEGRITRLTVSKGQGGVNEARELSVEVTASVITTTTAPALHAENQTRVFDLFVDESEKLTGQVLARQAAESAGTVTTADDELEVWRAAIDMLEPVPTVVPWAPFLAARFPKRPIRARRDFPRVLALVKAHALLHQRQRPRDGQGCIVATHEDWRAVRPLVQRVLGPSMTGLSEKAVKLAKLHDELTKNDAQEWLRRPDLEKEAAARRIASKNVVHKWVRHLVDIGVWEGRSEKGTWEHRRLRDVQEEPVALPHAEDLPLLPEAPTSAGGKQKAPNDAEDSEPPTSPTPEHEARKSTEEPAPLVSGWEDWEDPEMSRDEHTDASHAPNREAVGDVGSEAVDDEDREYLEAERLAIQEESAGELPDLFSELTGAGAER